MKKLLLALGATASIALPIGVAVSCSMGDFIGPYSAMAFSNGAASMRLLISKTDSITLVGDKLNREQAFEIASQVYDNKDLDSVTDKTGFWITLQGYKTQEFNTPTSNRSAIKTALLSVTFTKDE